MIRGFEILDRHLRRLRWVEILFLSIAGVFVVGGLDFLTGHEVSMSLFYLLPVSAATWYGGRKSGVGIAVVSCVGWYIADFSAGGQYSHRLIPVWNALVRLGFFLIISLLLFELRKGFFQLRHLALTDFLTELQDRRAFDERLRQNLALAKRHKRVLTVAYIDLDDFKAVNDIHGHIEGDRVLRAIGQALKDSIRDSDTAARIGGDEFALILPDTDRLGARQVISKFRGKLRKALEPCAGEITCSIGVVTALDATISPEYAVAAADKLMYDVKRKGKGAVAFRELNPIQHHAA